MTVAFEECAAGRYCLLRTLTNTRPVPVTVVVRHTAVGEKRIPLMPFQRRLVYPPLLVRGGWEGLFSLEAGGREP